MRKNLAALTQPDDHPPGYISINDEGDGRVSITIREPPLIGQAGKQATLTLTPDQWANVRAALTA